MPHTTNTGQTADHKRQPRHPGHATQPRRGRARSPANARCLIHRPPTAPGRGSCHTTHSLLDAASRRAASVR
jgi:hypothetical protein